jgi:hypothetical protein
VKRNYKKTFTCIGLIENNIVCPLLILTEIGELVRDIAEVLHPPMNPGLQAHMPELERQNEFIGHCVEVWHT